MVGNGRESSVGYTAVELRTGVFAGEEAPVLNQSEV
jgi:hypothetical protein